MEAGRRLGGRLRGARPQVERGQVDRDTRGSHLRLALTAQGPGRGLWVVRREREGREGLCQGVGEGDEPRPLRPRLQQGSPRHRGGVAGRRRVARVAKPGRECGGRAGCFPALPFASPRQAPPDARVTLLPRGEGGRAKRGWMRRPPRTETRFARTLTPTPLPLEKGNP